MTSPSRSKSVHQLLGVQASMLNTANTANTASLLAEPASQPQIVTPNTLEMKRPTEPNFAFSKRVSHKLVITI